SVLWETGKLSSTKNEKLQDTQGLEYKDYFQFSEPVRQIPPHRILALNRGEKEGVLKVKLEWHVEAGNQATLRSVAESLLSLSLSRSLKCEKEKEKENEKEKETVASENPTISPVAEAVGSP